MSTQPDVLSNDKQRNAATRLPLLHSIMAPLRMRDFRLLFSGQMISSLGDMFYMVALPWYMLTSRYSAQELGIVLACYGVMRIATLLPGGMLSDRLRPRSVMLLADSARALLMGGLVLRLLGGHPAVWQLCALSAPLGAFTGLFIPAYFSMMPEVLPEEDLQAGNALTTATTQLAILVGYAAAGIVVSRLQPALALAVDALTFVVSAMTLLAMRRRSVHLPAAGDSELERADSEKASGADAGNAATTIWQLLSAWRLLQLALLVIVIANLTFGGMLEVALPTLARSVFASGAGGYGLMMGSLGAGGLLGASGAGALGRMPHRGKIMMVLIMITAGCYGFIPFAGGISGAALLLAGAGLANGLLNILFFTIVQQQTPRHLLGRIMGVLMIASLGLYPLSVALGGFVTVHFGPEPLFVATGVALLGGAAFGWSQGEIREL